MGGQDWQVEIPKALATSDAIIICLTKNSVDKEGYIQKEIKFALDKALEMPEGRIFLIPVKFEECEVPFTLSRYQWVDLTVESGYAKMMKALKFRASQLERSTVEVSKKDIEEENFAREKKERETAERELKDKELREKQARESSEKANREFAKKEEKPPTVKPKTGGQIAYWFGGFIILVLGIILLSSLNNTPSTPQSTPEKTQTETIATLTQNTVEPKLTATPKSTLTPASTLTPTPLPTEITDTKGVSMMLVSIDSASSYFVPPFYMDKYEVTNDLYKECVDVGFCSPPTNSIYFNQVSYSQHPIVYVTLDMANAFCSWRNSRLPTYDEFVAAIKERDSSLYYPWITTKSTDCRYANFASGYYRYCIGTTAPVGSYELGKSASNIYDLIGNVAEWSDNYYILGGSWASWMPSLFRQTLITDDPISTNTIGFRCAKAAQ
ncbi:MAG: hypothetical protein OHK003_28640 [Anaerolineales bacterium]